MIYKTKITTTALMEEVVMLDIVMCMIIIISQVITDTIKYWNLMQMGSNLNQEFIEENLI